MSINELEEGQFCCFVCDRILDESEKSEHNEDNCKECEDAFAEEEIKGQRMIEKDYWRDVL